VRSGERSTRPDESVAPLIDREALVLDAFVLHIFQGRIVARELPLEGAGGQVTALAQEGGHLIQEATKSTLSPPCLGLGLHAHGKIIIAHVTGNVRQEA
jgi:hypothetical protein